MQEVFRKAEILEKVAWEGKQVLVASQARSFFNTFPEIVWILTFLQMPVTEINK